MAANQSNSSRTIAYIGRFAPSPTGALHAGSLVAALASWLDARAHRGKWLVRIEDIDAPRCVPGASEHIMRQLAACGLLPDEPPVYQSQRGSLYQSALDQLITQGMAYPCTCSRKDIEQALAIQGIRRQRGEELIYPGTCRSLSADRPMHKTPAWRLHTALQSHFYKKNRHVADIYPASIAIDSVASSNSLIHWQDRRLGDQKQDVSAEVGDFVLKRTDDLWAYQLAVVVDDAAQGITHIVRGEDLADNTPRQILLQRALGYATPLYLHTPLLLAPDGRKLSKQNGAAALDLSSPAAISRALRDAASCLQLPLPSHIREPREILQYGVAVWREQPWCKTTIAA